MGTNRAFVRRHNGEGRRRWWILALSLFLLFDIALVAFALNANSARTATGELRLSSTASASTTPTPSVTPTLTVAPTVAVSQRLLAAISVDVAWRGVVGTCPDGLSELEYTNDGGESWAVVDPARATGANTLVRVALGSTSEAHVVTLDGECAPQLVGTFVAGEAWEDYSSNLGSYWYVDPADRGNIHAPDGTVAAPCESVVAIATRSSSEAVALCADQALFATSDGGAEWSSTISVPGAVAIDASADGYVIAVAAQGGCVGTSVVMLAGGEPSEPVGCFGEAAPSGQTSLAAAGDNALWLWAGDNFAQSTDGGETWIQILT
ncbi:hypothetical protein [Mycetocola miduiensis]|uniref:BNR/Asp-box repeat-containing protein n=1 Tax=Mycetocola miduiensis TaxID=995034 RepID=A0A1I4YD99_9MICO|nr:hypothetical protein [Mycetocola miduiensis]SFN36017.1 hypothetical protein SAMN05216219_0137 [Mycetocola miduiensis]